MAIDPMWYGSLGVYYNSHMSNLRLGIQSMNIEGNVDPAVNTFYNNLITGMDTDIPPLVATDGSASPSFTVTSMDDIPVFCEDCGNKITNYEVRYNTWNPSYIEGISYHCDRCYVGLASFNSGSFCVENYKSLNPPSVGGAE